MILYGAAYYPEYWPEATQEREAAMMAKCHFNAVRVGEFAWSKFEPSPGRFDFSWMDRALDRLAKHKIKAVMGTPTGGVPPWFTDKHKDSLILKQDGSTAGWGNRYFSCYNHGPFLEASRRIVAAQVRHFAKDRRILGWHLHNELGNSPCYCERCRKGFQDWLKAKYGSVKELNRRWGTTFWSQIVNDWAEIPVPINTHHASAPALELDWQRYYAALVARYAAEQAAIIRKLDRGKWISTNVNMGDAGLFPVLDRVGYNNYPHTWDGMDDLSNSYVQDWMRAPGKALNPLSFEQRGGQPGWDLVSRLNRPGELRLLAWQALAHGTDGMTYFLWRIARFGHENLWGGILRHDGSFHPEVFPAVAQIGAELEKIGPLLEGSKVESPVAILRSQDSAWALKRQPQQERLSYDGESKAYYNAGARFGVDLDVIQSSDELSRYRLAIMPLHYVMTEELAARLKRFVSGGGVLVSGFRSAVADACVGMPEEEGPIWLQDLFGVKVEAYDVQEVDRYRTRPEDPPNLLKLGKALGGGTALAHRWYDLLSLNGAEALGSYAKEFYKGRPAISRHRYGKGWAIYVGCAGDAKLYDRVFRMAARLAGLKPLMKVPAGVEVRERKTTQGTLRFILNYTRSKKGVSPGFGYRDALSGAAVKLSFTLEPYGVAVLKNFR